MVGSCSSCGHPVAAGDRFCGSCGALQPQPAPTDSFPPGNARRSRVPVVAVVTALVVVAGAVTYVLWPENDDQRAAPAPTSTSTSLVPTTAPVTPAPEPAVTTTSEGDALTGLNSLRDTSLTQVTLDGRWVAQIASKNVGISDPLQTTSTGSHVFMAADILKESEQLAAYFSDTPVYVLASTDFGKSSVAPDGTPYWTTVVDAGFGSADAVRSWCDAEYASLSPEEIANACAPRQLTPPHD